MDASKKSQSLNEDLQIRSLINKEPEIFVATKADLLPQGWLSKKLDQMQQIFDAHFLVIGAKTSSGLERLKNRIDNKILDFFFGSKADSRKVQALREMTQVSDSHRQRLIETGNSIKAACRALKEDNIEAAAMFLRSAISELGQISRPVDEAVLDKIFQSFCIGK